jgi:hypothetical protein
MFIYFNILCLHHRQLCVLTVDENFSLANPNLTADHPQPNIFQGILKTYQLKVEFDFCEYISPLPQKPRETIPLHCRNTFL